ncbi:SLAC1 family transporter [Spiroplasma chrysopicola]|uniref:Uncharacterized protein n=1 Tax=Spiroplasma chrysopicola DF-1 TaxID=1276227 RepID=R4UJT4_9MOLU|nr:hypothetical protein [Spiroplasma chrysopicola]AGM25571.1 hypothetical protein SCHRY_v1c09990 [Spiroplasma chrysopicola DF-1]
MEKHKAFLNYIPFSLLSISLGLLTLGNGWNAFGNFFSLSTKWITYLTFALSLFIFLLITTKWIVNFKSVQQEFQNNLNDAAIIGFLPITVLAISKFILTKQDLNNLNTGWIYYFGITIWWIGLILAFSFFIVWLFLHFKNFKLVNATGSWYIPTIGIIICSTFELKYLGPGYLVFLQVLWYLNFVIFLGLTILMLISYFKTKDHEMLRSLFILLIGLDVLMYITYDYTFIKSGYNENYWMILIIGVFAIAASFAFYLLIVKDFLTKQFNPKLTSYAFPLAISAIGKITYGQSLGAISSPKYADTIIYIFQYWSICEIILTSIIFLYLIGNLTFHFGKKYWELQRKKVG